MKQYYAPTYSWAQDNSTVTAEREEIPNSNIDVDGVYATTNGKKIFKKILGGIGNDNVKNYYLFTKTPTNNQTRIRNANLIGYNKRLIGDDNIDEDGVETETVNTTYTTISSATCSETGEMQYVATFTNSAFTTQYKNVTIPVRDHIAGYTKVEVKKAATCTAEGINDLVTYCRFCGQEIARESRPSEKKPHTSGKVVRENVIAGTCSIEGSYERVVYCKVCGEEISRRTVSTGYDSNVHTPGEPVRENETATSYDSVVYCSACGTEISRETIPIT